MNVQLQTSHVAISFSVLVFLLSSTTLAKRDYCGSKIIEARLNSESQSWFVNELSHNGHLLVLNPTQNPAHLHHKRSSIIAEVSSKKWPTTRKLLIHRKVEFDIIVDDYQKYVEASQVSSERSSQFDVDYYQETETETGYSDEQNTFDGKSTPAFDFNRYNKLSDIDVFLDALQNTPSKHVQVKEYGRSTEGRRLRAVHVERGVQRYNTCSEVYAGPYPFSEPEVAALSDLVEYYRQRTILYVSLHAFSQVILSPYGYTRGRPRDYAQHLTIMKAGAEAIKEATGYVYKFGPIYEAMYAASGSAIDYLYGSLKIKQAFVIELRDTGRFGFVLPEDEIAPTCKETIAAVLAMSKAAQVFTKSKRDF
ncbi:hypothetical protein RvY_04028 [Ramazzottius varieornatus]|uniref:Peptidase M14 domain-containing protein n=1 Tax=Ramazzottius varieornatus TaxID=947166 RepID=A0A1D1UQ47_RAMVA|nr:hypothetical protein RvY_04028 [Ramazzottius varieornatus]